MRFLRVLGAVLLTATAVAQQNNNGTLIISVLDPVGVPIPRALVTARSAAPVIAAITNDKGVAEIKLPPHDYQVTVSASGLSNYLENLTVSDGQAKEESVRLKLCCSVPSVEVGQTDVVSLQSPVQEPEPLGKVTITDPSGAIVDGADVIFVGDKDQFLLKSDRVGQVNLVVPAGKYDLIVKAPGFEDGQTDIYVEIGRPWNEKVSLRVDPSFSVISGPGNVVLYEAGITLTVKDPAGAVIQNARVTFKPEVEHRAYRTDNTGTLNIGLDPGHYQLTITSPGFRTTSIDVKASSGNQAVSVVLPVESLRTDRWPHQCDDSHTTTLVVDSGLVIKISSLEGKIYDSQGKPLSDAKVQVKSLDGKSIMETVLTAADGSFRLKSNPGSSEQSIQVTAEGHDMLVLHLIIDQRYGKPLTIRMPAHDEPPCIDLIL